MACDAIGRSFALLVTAEAPAHREWCCLNRGVHPRDVTVTNPALDAGSDVPFVREADEVRQVMHAEPGDRLLPFPVSQQLHDLGLLRSDRQMALGTALNRRNAGHRAAAGVRVAKETRHRVVASVDAMAEFDRLSRRSLGAYTDEECE
jgi:hypothetical protein